MTWSRSRSTSSPARSSTVPTSRAKRRRPPPCAPRRSGSQLVLDPGQAQQALTRGVVDSTRPASNAPGYPARSSTARQGTSERTTRSVRVPLGEQQRAEAARARRGNHVVDRVSERSADDLEVRQRRVRPVATTIRTDRPAERGCARRPQNSVQVTRLSGLRRRAGRCRAATATSPADPRRDCARDRPRPASCMSQAGRSGVQSVAPCARAGGPTSARPRRPLRPTPKRNRRVGPAPPMRWASSGSRAASPVRAERRTLGSVMADQALPRHTRTTRRPAVSYAALAPSRDCARDRSGGAPSRRPGRTDGRFPSLTGASGTIALATKRSPTPCRIRAAADDRNRPRALVGLCRRR